MVLAPEGKVPIEVNDMSTARILTVLGRGAAIVDGDRVELHQLDLLEIEPGCPYALRCIGRVEWQFLLIKTDP